MLLATSYDAIQLKERGFKLRCTTWRAVSGRPYSKASDQLLTALDTAADLRWGPGGYC